MSWDRIESNVPLHSLQVPAGCGESSPGSRLATVLDAVTSVREMADIKKSRAINTR